MKKVSVIIGNKNTGGLLKNSLKNLAQIKRHDYEELEVIVVDRASDDGSEQMVAKEFPEVTLVETVDKGLAAALNLGAAKATGDYLVFLSPAAYPRNITIPRMINYMEEHRDVGLSTPKLYLDKGSLDHDAHRSFPTPWSSFTRLTGLYKLFPKSPVFNSYFMWSENLEEEHEIDACVIGFMLVRKEVFTAIEGFDSDYKLHGFDLDFCYKIKQAGHKIMYLPKWESGHLKIKIPSKKHKFKKMKDEPLGARIAFAKSSTQAMRIFLKKNYKGVYAVPLVWFMVLATYLLEVLRIFGAILRYIFY